MVKIFVLASKVVIQYDSIFLTIQTPSFYKKHFKEYEVVIDYREKASFKRVDNGYKWSVWYRYSAFEALDAQLRKTLAWRMDSIKFPDKHTLSSSLSQEFIDKRKADLDTYFSLVGHDSLLI